MFFWIKRIRFRISILFKLEFDKFILKQFKINRIILSISRDKELCNCNPIDEGEIPLPQTIQNFIRPTKSSIIKSRTLPQLRPFKTHTKNHFTNASMARSRSRQQTTANRRTRARPKSTRVHPDRLILIHPGKHGLTGSRWRQRDSWREPGWIWKPSSTMGYFGTGQVNPDDRKLIPLWCTWLVVVRS